MERNKYNQFLKSLPENVIRSVFYKMANQKAKSVASNPARILNLIQQGINHIGKLKNKPDILSEIKQNLGLFLRMISAIVKKQYTDITPSTLIKIATAVIYLLFIVDLIPDFIPVIGLMDDATVIAWVATAIKSDLDKFREWEKRQA